MQKLGSLTRPTQFRDVLQGGMRFRSPGLSLATSPSTEGVRLGLSVHARGATQRNRIKRRLRAAFREAGLSSDWGADVVVRADSRVESISYQELVMIARGALSSDRSP